MTTVVGIKFQKTNKIYYFNPQNIACALGDSVVVETARGTEIGEVVMAPMQLDDDKVVAPLKNVVRKVNDRDRQQAVRNKGQEAEAFKVFEQKIAEYNLVMKPVDVEYAFDGSKITFYFTADGRVDFRELVKGLAHHFRARIELRQIGVRDEAKMLGGLGKCGCPICCKRFLPEFTPVSIKMAKEQNISLNPSKISGLCGRLMCCLNYEQPFYEEMRKKMPRNGATVQTPDGTGTVVENNPLLEKVKVKVERSDGMFETNEYALADLQFDKQRPPQKKGEQPQPKKERDPQEREKRRPRERNREKGERKEGDAPRKSEPRPAGDADAPKRHPQGGRRPPREGNRKKREPKPPIQ